MADAPDTTTFTVLHRAMRTDAARLAQAVAEMDEDDRVERATVLARWYRSYMTELHDHHEIEDELFYPALRTKVPAAGPMIDRIDVDHDHLSDLLDRTAVLLDKLADPSVSFRSTHADAVMVTDGLRALLDSHLGFEDDDVVPLFGVHFTADEYDAIDGQAKKHINFKQLLFVIPWVMASSSEAEQQQLFDNAPFIFKLVWWAGRGRYRKLDEAAFGQLSLTPVAV
jgi:hemerythrin-like domain-containing protein